MTEKQGKWLEFEYDYRGFGDLKLFAGAVLIDDLLCRTGSIGQDGKLKNAIPVGDWFLIDESVATTEPGMSIHLAVDGWKIRLYRKTDKGIIRTHYLVHPDGGLSGTEGCIGIQGTNAQGFRFELDAAVRVFGKIHVKVGQKK